MRIVESNPGSHILFFDYICEVGFVIFHEIYGGGKHLEGFLIGLHVYAQPSNLMVCVKFPIRTRPKLSHCEWEPVPWSRMFMGWGDKTKNRPRVLDARMSVFCSRYENIIISSLLYVPLLCTGLLYEWEMGVQTWVQSGLGTSHIEFLRRFVQTFSFTINLVGNWKSNFALEFKETEVISRVWTQDPPLEELQATTARQKIPKKTETNLIYVILNTKYT